MTGGLIQIASYGIHDIFLTGNPQITFFKTVYKRHTNFAMEYIEEPLSGIQNFGGSLSCNLAKTGDLLHKLYLKIVIPEVLIKKNAITQSTYYSDLKQKYDTIQRFINIINYNIVQMLYKLINVDNIKYSEINSKYNIALKRMNYDGELKLLTDIYIKFNETFRVPLSNAYPLIDNNIIYVNQQTQMIDILDFNTYYGIYFKTTSTNIQSDLQFLLDNYMLQLKIIKARIYNQLNFYEKLDKIIMRENLNFAWVEYLGQQIINNIELTIGGKIIDSFDGRFMNIRYQLTNKILQDETYNRLIGNVPELTIFNSQAKPAYVLYIPLDFWFTKYSGLALPLIYLRYHDVVINVKLNDLATCCYYEKLPDNTAIEDLISLDSVSLIANYIYLDSDERHKFAQLSQEYLIDQVQSAQFDFNIVEKMNIELPFFNPIKQLYWVTVNKNNLDRLIHFDYSANYYVDIYNFQNEDPSEVAAHRTMIKIQIVDKNMTQYIKTGDNIHIINSINYSGSYKVVKAVDVYITVEFDEFIREDYSYNYDVDTVDTTIVYKKTNYSGNSQAFIKKINNISPIARSTLELNGVQLFDKIDYMYTNFIQPYQHNSRSPNYGINTYSFALNPEEYQPSGFSNFNRLDLKTMTYLMNTNYLIKMADNQIMLYIYGHGYNILKLAYGKAGIVLNI